MEALVYLKLYIHLYNGLNIDHWISLRYLKLSSQHVSGSTTRTSLLIYSKYTQSTVSRGHLFLYTYTWAFLSIPFMWGHAQSESTDLLSSSRQWSSSVLLSSSTVCFCSPRGFYRYRLVSLCCWLSWRWCSLRLFHFKRKLMVGVRGECYYHV